MKTCWKTPRIYESCELLEETECHYVRGDFPMMSGVILIVVGVIGLAIVNYLDPEELKKPDKFPYWLIAIFVSRD